jgi:predicted ABC-type ATPase
MKTKRLRIYAGPNGSGKSVLHHKLSAIVNNYYFVNADILYKELSLKKFYDFDESGIGVDDYVWKDFLENHGLKDRLEALTGSQIKKNVLKCENNFNSYDVAVLADFIRNQLLANGKSFSCETVFSHPSKLDLLKYAKELGFKTYLYFCCAGDETVCVERIKQRVEEGGHSVPEEKVRQRFKRSLNNLLPAIKLVDRAYIFDNSGEEFELIIETNKNELKVLSENIPNWINDVLLSKLINES